MRKIHLMIMVASLSVSSVIGACTAQNPDSKSGTSPVNQSVTQKVIPESSSEMTPEITLAMSRRIANVLTKQAAAWNAGDIDEFMQAYWKSGSLRFASGGRVNLGWEAARTGYKTRYPDKDAMGELIFRDVEVKVLSREYAQVFGHWTLIRKNDAPGGLFTLLMQKMDGEWRIVTDHTSSK